MPIVKEYRYLGILLNEGLDLDYAARDRAEKLKKTLFSTAHFLKTRSIPSHIRIDVLKALIGTKAVYGAELFGFSAERSSLFQKWINMGLRWCFDVGSKHYTLSNVVMWEEAHYPPIEAIHNSLKAQAWGKWQHLKMEESWIGSLVQTHLVSRLGTFVKNSSRWLNTFWKVDKKTKVLKPLEQKQMKLELWKKISKKDTTQSGKIYLRHRLFETRGWDKEAYGRWPLYAIRGLRKLRFHDFPSAQKLAGIGEIPKEFQRKCPFCRDSVPESAEHFLLGCEAWKDQRKLTLESALKLCPKSLKSDKFHFLLGGEEKDRDAQSRSSPEKKRKEKMGPWLAAILSFLQSVIPRRSQMLSQLVASIGHLPPRNQSLRVWWL